jgi:putative heme-binding domain-containing protein
MRVVLTALFFGLSALALVANARADAKGAQAEGEPQWIWFDEGDPAAQAPAETRYFRKVFKLKGAAEKAVDEAELDITADDQFTVWVNGKLVGTGDNWRRVYRFDLRTLLKNGENVIAVEARNHQGPAGLLVRMGYVPNGASKLAQLSDASWKAAKVTGKDWQNAHFNDGSWTRVKVLGSYGQAGPWRNLAWDAGGEDRFRVPPGFRVEMAARNPDPSDPFSLVNLCFDDRGRLLVSRENGPILLCTKPGAKGVCQSVEPYCSLVKNSQGMLWDGDGLLLVGEGSQGTGLYKVSATRGVDRADKARLLHKFPRVEVPHYGRNGGMGEHGPHAVFRGPDGWLYLIMGNHAWAGVDQLASNSPLVRWPHGLMGPDQGRPGTTEDVLLPRLNDSRGHAANILAPGSTIWRMDHEGKSWSLVAAGFRNAYDAAFSPSGELFTFDSDMEWDEALPWYRPVRVCHCPPGADYVWRTGSANTPEYYIDSLPPVLATGRGSPVGMEFYQHDAFPEKYRGALFMGDWSLGIIWAVHLQREGASYTGSAERFCQGAPMNVTDVAVGPDGALYFTMGGRGSQGGVYRISYGKSAESSGLAMVQPLSEWSRAREKQKIDDWVRRDGKAGVYRALSDAILARLHHTLTSTPSVALRDWLGLGTVRFLDVMQNHGLTPQLDLLEATAAAADSEVRAHAVWLMGVNGYKDGREALLRALRDPDPLVRRHACEAFIRAGIEPPVDAIWPLLGDLDPFVRTAARLVLERIDPGKWADRIGAEPKNEVAWEAIVALCKHDRAAAYTQPIFARLDREPPRTAALLDYLRTVQLALVHTSQRPGPVRNIAQRLFSLFPLTDWRANRELAILLTEFRRKEIIDAPVHGRLLDALLRAGNDRMQQIHYFYCLRLLHQGWTTQQKEAVLKWYDSTMTWTGGHSFTPFLENILGDFKSIFTADDVARLVATSEGLPWAATALLRMNLGHPPAPEALAGLYARLMKTHTGPRASDLKEAIIDILGRDGSPAGARALRSIEDLDPAQRDAVTRALALVPLAENWAHLVRGLQSRKANVLLDAISALGRINSKPKAEDPVPYRTLLLAVQPLSESQRWKVVELLRHWSDGKRFGADDGDAKTELTSWARWFAQSFPKEPALPDVASDKPVESRYKFAELLTFLDHDPVARHGDPGRGRAIFEKAQCLKCHKYGKEGEGIGPDLTTVSKRFKRADILESIYYPSKVISDQYRSTLIVTKKGQQINGLAAPLGDTITVLQSDGSKIALKKDDIDQQFASLVSVMPERLLDPLNKQEIADLFSFLESTPK